MTLNFEEYLKRYAPYETEDELEEWLAVQDILPIAVTMSDGDLAEFTKIKHQLTVAFAEDQPTWLRKRDILIEHDAKQILVLQQERQSGNRALFVTADRKLRDWVTKGAYATIANSMISHIGMAQLIDLLAGAPRSHEAQEAMGRLLWSPKISSDYEVARNYYIDLSLSRYDEALAMNMGDVVEKTANLVAEQARSQGISLLQAQEHGDSTAVQLLGQFEEKFFEGMREIIEKRRSQGE